MPSLKYVSSFLRLDRIVERQNGGSISSPIETFDATISIPFVGINDL